MRIHAVSFNDNVRKWRFEPIKFNQLTLLVGASGVGKTQILVSIMRLQQITRGKSLNGVTWEIDFSTSNGETYHWRGEFEKQSIIKTFEALSYIGEEERYAPKIIFEELCLGDTKLFERDDKNIMFDGKQTVKLPQQKSAIYLLKEEELIANVYNDFQKLIISDLPGVRISINPVPDTNKISVNQIPVQEEYKTLVQIQESDFSIRTKLYLAYEHQSQVFEEIKNRFIDVFTFVEDLKVTPIIQPDFPVIFHNTPFIQIKEIGVDEWVDERYLSAGMYKTLAKIGELYLSVNGTVTLLDEFENSLGVNCINEVTANLLGNQRDLQFIITSHHPYIINNIGYENWKLVTRKGGVVTAHDASDFNLGKSRHEAFTQLINLDLYADGPQS